jgi:hypothetical protein
MARDATGERRVARRVDRRAQDGHSFALHRDMPCSACTGTSRRFLRVALETDSERRSTAAAVVAHFTNGLSPTHGRFWIVIGLRRSLTGTRSDDGPRARRGCHDALTGPLVPADRRSVARSWLARLAQARSGTCGRRLAQWSRTSLMMSRARGVGPTLASARSYPA